MRGLHQVVIAVSSGIKAVSTQVLATLRSFTCSVPVISKHAPRLRRLSPSFPDPFISTLTSKRWAAALPDANSPHERESV